MIANLSKVVREFRMRGAMRGIPSLAHRHLAKCEQQVSLPFDRQGLPNRAGRTFGHRAIQASAPRRTTPGSQAAGGRRVVSTYQRCLLWYIESCFRRMKQTGLEVRPMFHWTPRRIEA